MKGIIYIRVSSDEQIKGTSLEFQEDLCRKYCEQKGIEVLGVFREEGESAKSLSLNNRKKFLEALEFCRKKKNSVQAFVVLRLDRFARNTEDHFAVRKILLDCGTSVYSVSEPIGNKPSEKFVETVLAGAAEYENAIRKQRCTDGMTARINQGIYPWKAPLGYNCLHLRKQGKKKTEPDQPDEQIFPLIQKALKTYTRGQCSMAELAKLLDKWGLKAIRGKRTTRQTIDYLLGRYLKFYTGIIVNPWTGEEKGGLHRPMITREEMQKILLVRSGKARSVKYHKYNPDFPLRKTVLCGECNKPLTGSAPRGNGGRYYYYHCINKSCPSYGKSIPKRILEDEFSEYLNTIIPKDKFLKVFRETVFDLWKEKKESTEAETQKFEKHLVQLNIRRRRIFEMREEGSYTKEEFLERKKEIEEEIMAAKLSLEESRVENFDIEGVLTYAIDFIRNLGKQWFALSPELRFRFQKLIFPAGISYQKNSKFGTTELGMIFKLNQAFLKGNSQQKSYLVDFLRPSWNHFIKELKVWQGLREVWEHY